MESLFSVKDKVVFVTGASSGLGCHFAKTLARAGAKVALGARRLEKLENIVHQINNEGGIALPFCLDVTQPESVEHVVNEIESKLGPINVLINNAGVDARKNLLEMEESDWQPVIDTNLKGLVLVTKAVARKMISHQKGGSIINISSVSDAIAFKGGNPAYMMSKAGVSHFTHLLALELANNNVRANTIAPGIYRTEINDDLFDSEMSAVLETKIPMLRFGNLNDLDGALFLLCSDASRYITGTILRVDGGLGINKLQF
jgi:NAD(P)-dependent dehydrogenase (short-subunit alcohol dehydrogenase family)